MHKILDELSTGSDRDLQRLAAFSNITEVYTIFKDYGMFVPRDRALRARECIDSFYEHWAWM
eukprot:8160930-Pyramimonas_sp.AAC.1